MATDTYNKVFTMHGIIMVFFFLVPSVPATLGNFLIPMMIGAKDLALPKINLLSWYLYMAAGILAIYTMASGGVDTGWTFTTPLSTHYVNTHVITTGLAVFIAGFSSIFTGLNFIVTIHKMRCAGYDLVPAAAVRVVELCGQHPDGAGHAGAGHHAGVWSFWSARSALASSIRPRAATRFCSSTCSGFTRTRPSTS